LAGFLQPLVNAPTPQAFAVAEKTLLQEIQRRGKEALGDWLEASLPEVKTYLVFPRSHYRQIKSTNPQERLMEELRRRERVVRIFPGVASCELLMGAVLEDQSEDWVTGRRYMVRDLDKVWEIVARATGKQERDTEGAAAGQDAPTTFTPQFGT
jgi:transposase-like protein